MRNRGRSGAVLLETAMWTPVLILLFLGTVELSRVTYTYYTLKKILYDFGRSAATLQGANFCDESDAQIVAAKARAISGTADGAGPALLPDLAADQITLRLERYIPETASLSDCVCEATVVGCDASQGAPAPDYLVVTLPEGYPITLRFPGILNEPIPLRPVIRLPFGGV
ncbi:MAG: pilus assembly protein [Acidobacteria bacterium]|nr:pilus assembly protein [Acidobacteriota bacterium]